eukprot:6474884-Amphidinium_carterae.1
MVKGDVPEMYLGATILFEGKVPRVLTEKSNSTIQLVALRLEATAETHRIACPSLDHNTMPMRYPATMLRLQSSFVL